MATKKRTTKAKKDAGSNDLCSAARSAPIPAIIHPMLATLVDEPFDDDKWLFEIKWDGYRSVAFVNEKGDHGVRLVSRNQIEMTPQYP